MTDTFDDALNVTGLDKVRVRQKHTLLSNNGPYNVSGEPS